jgi:hypothetical protein
MTADKVDTTTEGVYYAEPQAVNAFGGRQGHLFFGCCCDMRRAVIIVDIINTVFASLNLLAILTFTLFGSNLTDSFDDDVTKNDMAIATSYPVVAIVMAVFALVCPVLGIVGAARYSGWMVIVPAVWYCVDMVISILSSSPAGAALAVMFIYPHIFLFKQLNKGIMTMDNYPNEIHSCCCV